MVSEKGGGEREKTALACIQCLYSRVERKIMNAIKCGQINQMRKLHENIAREECSITSNGI